MTRPLPTLDQVHEGDCLDHLSQWPDSFVDLVYLDPPFSTGRRRIDRAGSFDDSFNDVHEYLAFLCPRIEQLLRVLKPDGALLLHCDWRTVHHLRLLLDELLGADRFINHLIWRYGLGGSSPRRFARKHDDILYYARSDSYYFQPPLIPARSNRLRGKMKKATDVLDIPTLNNMSHERTGYPTQKPLALLTLLIEACCPPAVVHESRIAHASRDADSAEDDAGVSGTEAGAVEVVGNASEAEVGPIVLDPFCGSGTTLIAARATGRRTLGIDRNPDAVRIASARLAAMRLDTTRLTATPLAARQPHSSMPSATPLETAPPRVDSSRSNPNHPPPAADP